MICSAQPPVLGGSRVTHKSSWYQNSLQGQRDLEATVKQEDSPERPIRSRVPIWLLYPGDNAPRGKLSPLKPLIPESLHQLPLGGCTGRICSAHLKTVYACARQREGELSYKAQLFPQVLTIASEVEIHVSLNFINFAKHHPSTNSFWGYISPFLEYATVLSML